MVQIDLVDETEQKNIFCTLFIIVLLMKRFIDQYDEWVLFERKALRWLKNLGVEANEKILSVMNLI